MDKKIIHNKIHNFSRYSGSSNFKHIEPQDFIKHQSQIEIKFKIDSTQEISLASDQAKINLELNNSSSVPQEDRKQDSTTLTELSYDCCVTSKNKENKNPKFGTQTNHEVVLQTTESESQTLENEVQDETVTLTDFAAVDLNLNSDDEVKRDTEPDQSELIKNKDNKITSAEIESKIVSQETSENYIKLQSEQKVSEEKIDVKVIENKVESDQVNINLKDDVQFTEETFLESEIKEKEDKKVIAQSEFSTQDDKLDIKLQLVDKDLDTEKAHQVPILVHPNNTNEDKIELLPESQGGIEIKKERVRAADDKICYKKHPVSHLTQLHQGLRQCVIVHHKTPEVRPLRPPDIKHIPVVELSRNGRGRRSLATIRAMDNGPPYIESGWMGNTTPCNYSTAHKEFFRIEVNRPRELVKPPAVLRTGYGYTNNKPKYVSTTQDTYRDPEEQYVEESVRRASNPDHHN